ncbi:MAG: hypothetical protein OXE83_02475, partial [Gammaproteobacteria bacterium]|nr:hypothetical protein [Gammaproteobacteria bacterium]
MTAAIVDRHAVVGVDGGAALVGAEMRIERLAHLGGVLTFDQALMGSAVKDLVHRSQVFPDFIGFVNDMGKELKVGIHLADEVMHR